LVAMQAAYQDGQDWYEQLMVYLEGNRDYVYRYVQEELPGISMAKPEGTYLAWLDCRETGIPKNPCEFFIEKGRVGLNDGKTFGSGGEGFVRLNFGCPREVLSEGLARIRQALESLEGD
jgi:cystathionine beta-lyase